MYSYLVVTILSISNKTKNQFMVHTDVNSWCTQTSIHGAHRHQSMVHTDINSWCTQTSIYAARCRYKNQTVNRLYQNDRISDKSKFKAFTDHASLIPPSVISVFDTIENFVAIGENAGTKPFLLVPQ